MLLFREDLGHRNRVLAAFLRAQATFGCDGAEAAVPMLHAVLKLDSNHPGASDLLQQAEIGLGEAPAQTDQSNTSKLR